MVGFWQASESVENLNVVHPFSAASIAATLIFFICIIASITRLAAARSGLDKASISTRGVIYQESPNLSLHHPQSPSEPPLPVIAFQ